MIQIKPVDKFYTNVETHSKKLRTLKYNYRRLFNFSDEIWIRIFSYMNVFKAIFEVNPYIENAKPKKMHIPNNVSSLCSVDFLSTVKKEEYYSILKSVPKNIQSLESCEKMNSIHSFTTDIFFLYPFRYLKTLILNHMFNEVIQPGIFPETLTYLNLGMTFNQKLVKGTFPQNLEVLIFSDCFNKPIKKDVLPNHLLKLELGRMFNKAFKRNFRFPSTLEEIQLGENFDQGLRYSFFPKKLKKLIILNNHFSKRIQRLPRNLHHLKISKYQHDIPSDWFPLSINTIHFDILMGKMMMTYLSPNLIEFTISSEYQYPILFKLNPYIQKYIIKHHQTQQLHEDFFIEYDKMNELVLYDSFKLFNFRLHESVKTLKIVNITLSPLRQFYLPNHLVTLSICYNHFPLEKGTLPPNLQELIMLEYKFPLMKGILPDKLKKLDINRYYSKRPIEPGVLPSSLKILKIGFDYTSENQTLIVGSIPNKVKELCLYGIHTRYPIGIFPSNLEKLILSSLIQPIEQGFLPKKLKSLSIHNRFNHVIEPNTLPKKLRYLNLGNEYFKPFKKNVLPTSLIHLRLGDSFNQSLEDVLPASIQYLRFGESFSREIPYHQIPKCKWVKLNGNYVNTALKNKPSHVKIELFDSSNRYPSDNESYGYYSDD